jgi:3-oxoacyl-[acyl-carrier protein] reductase
MDLELRDRVAVVTGGTRGLGHRVALELSAEGARVAIVARTEREVIRVARELDAVGIAADLTSGAARKRVVSEIQRRLGPIEILINNLGVRAGRSWEDTGPEEFELAMEGNLIPAQDLTEQALPDMLERNWGRVVVIASIYGIEAGGAPAYNAAKAAELAWVSARAASLAGTGVTLNAVAPGAMLYDGGSWHRRLQEEPARVAEFVKNELPANRFGTPEEVAAVVVFLSSTQASGINGACVVVDGAQSRSLQSPSAHL